MTRRTIAVAVIVVAAAALHAQQNDGARRLDERIGRIFDTREYDVPRFGPAKWLPDGTAYTTVERDAGSGGAPEIVRYDARTGARAALFSIAREDGRPWLRQRSAYWLSNRQDIRWLLRKLGCVGVNHLTMPVVPRVIEMRMSVAGFELSACTLMMSRPTAPSATSMPAVLNSDAPSE